MRRCKGYTNELENLTRDGGSVTIKLKKVAEKKRLRVIAYSQPNISILAQIMVI